MFNVGDRVIFTVNGSNLTGRSGTIVDVAYTLDQYEVKFDEYAIMLTCFGNEIELIPNLPTGFWLGDTESYLKPIVCDCGGFKTFNSMEPAMHSPWCSSIKNI